MALLLGGVGGVATPTPPGPIGRIMQRVLALRDLSPSPEVLRAVETISHLTKAEEAARKGISGPLLDQVIHYLETSGDQTMHLNDVVNRMKNLAPAVADAGYC